MRKNISYTWYDIEEKRDTKNEGEILCEQFGCIVFTNVALSY